MQYYALDLVTYQGSGYLVKEDCMGVIPVEGDYYQLLASKGNDGSDTRGSKRNSRIIIGTSTNGWTADDCDYLCDGTDLTNTGNIFLS